MSGYLGLVYGSQAKAREMELGPKKPPSLEVLKLG
jgi:hypothetical protein